MLPDWIDPDAWNGFVDMRKSIKKPMTPFAMDLLIRKLTEFHNKGHDATACLEQSILNNWQAIYPIKAEDVPNLKREEPTREEVRSPEQMAADIAARDAMLSKLGVRRVA